MIQSMTGFGEAELREGSVCFRVEIRAGNNRYLKASIKLPEHLQRFEADIDKLLRGRLSRGSLSYTLWVRDDNAAEDYQINTQVLARYVSRLEAAATGSSRAGVDLGRLLDLPGVCEPPSLDEATIKKRLDMVLRATSNAVDKLVAMRRAEGEALLKDLQSQCAEIRQRLAAIAARAPGVVQDYHARLRTRVNQLLEAASLELDQDVLAREVAVFAERCDVNEEIARLGSHLDQFEALCASQEEAGRKLDFLAQEMLREANTIGSKASDAEISGHVVAVKSAIDRIKEQVQNVA